MRDGIDHSVLPVFLLENLVIVAQYGIWRKTIASVCPYDHRRMGAKLANTRAQAGSGDPLVLCIPQVPMFPLRATHESQHHWHAFTISPVDHGVIGDLQLPAKQVEAEILGVMHDVRIALRIVPNDGETIGYLKDMQRRMRDSMVLFPLTALTSIGASP